MSTGKMRFFEIDTRGLAAFRIAVGVLIVCDAAVRVSYGGLYCGENGVVPMATSIQEMVSTPAGMFAWSLNFVNASTAYQISLTIVYGLCGGLLVAGWRTRLVNLVAWVLLASIQIRNPYIGNAGDTVLRLYLFWSLFLALDAKWSITKTKATESEQDTVNGGRAAGLMLQICFIYLFSSLIKGDPVWRVGGDALERALSLKSFARPLAERLLHHPDLLRHLTVLTIVVQELAPFLIFSPFYRNQLRVVVPIVMIGFHVLGIGLILAIGLFPWISAAGWLIFFPAVFWNRIESLVSRFGILRARNVPRENPPVRSRPSRGPGAIAWLLIVYVFFWNLPSVSRKHFGFLETVGFRAPGYILRLSQRWTLFAPKPRTRDGWYVSEATLKDGSVVDLISGGKPVSWEKPILLREYYGGMRPRKFLLDMFHRRSAERISAYVGYLRKRWDSENPDNAVVEIKLTFMLKDSLHPEEGTVNVQVYPIPELDNRGLAIFPDDLRRN